MGAPFSLGPHPSAAAVIDGRLYVTGSPCGFACYDRNLDLWQTLAGPKVARIEHVAITCRGSLYLCGGRTVRSNGEFFDFGTRSCEVYSPATGAWKGVTSLLVERHSHVGVGLGGTIFCFGGKSQTNSAECLDVTDHTARWCTIAMPTHLMVDTTRLEAALPLHSGCIALCRAGRVTRTSTWVHPLLYDPKARSWSVAAWKMPDLRSHYSAHVLPDGRVIVAGGFSTRPLDSCLGLDVPRLECSSGSDVRWTPLPFLPSPCFACTFC